MTVFSFHESQRRKSTAASDGEPLKILNFLILSSFHSQMSSRFPYKKRNRRLVDHFLEFRFLIINEKSLSETVFKLLIPFSSVATKLAKKLLPNDYKQSIHINQSYNNRSRLLVDTTDGQA